MMNATYTSVTREFPACWAGRNHYINGYRGPRNGRQVRSPTSKATGRRPPWTAPRLQAKRTRRSSCSARAWLQPRPAPPRRPRRTPMIRRSRRSPARRCTWPWGGRWPSPGPRCSGRCTSSPAPPPSCCSMSTRLPSSCPSVRPSPSSSTSSSPLQMQRSSCSLLQMERSFSSDLRVQKMISLTVFSCESFVSVAASINVIFTVRLSICQQSSI